MLQWKKSENRTLISKVGLSDWHERCYALFENLNLGEKSGRQRYTAALIVSSALFYRSLKDDSCRLLRCCT